VRLRIDAVTRRRESVSDIVQSACREVLANETFEYRGEAAFRSYLCEAALHKIRARRRHWLADKRDLGRERPPAPADSELGKVYGTTLFDPLRKAIRDEEIEKLEAAFDELPDAYREALTLSRIVGMPLAQLATRLGRSEGSTKMLLSRAMARLTSVLKKVE
jgi:RNA polymerase sigma factor (sigma-70 family)